MEKSLYVFGLTGGIASGKSTVADFMREAGVPVIDADQLGHQVLEPDGEAYGPVVEFFGRGILREDNWIDRQKLGEKVFDNPEMRARLESITHPAIAGLAQQGIALIRERGVKLAFYEAALLVETGTYKWFDGLVVVSCPVETQMRRVMARNGLTREAAAARIASQYPLEEKLSLADYVIDNDCDLDQVHAETMKILDAVKRGAGIE
jgi:dephospho-CoA kinase